MRDDQLTAPTPCAGATVAALVDHVHGLAQAFTAAARKELGPMTDQPPEASTGNLADDWRTDAPERLAALAQAWRDPDAWTGMTRAGGVDLPGNIAGLVALDELVVHGWDLATATGRPYTCDSAELAACTAFAESITAEQRDAGGLFGPAVPVRDGASALDRLVGLTGRDPAWAPARL
ncbi:TIGR03086 family metal-binding protein [Rhodococcus chondri]|uniref:TIGR03086 family metal-binding protein n=1 Tax=Rhodococcus chondri TaxID=3065941 RepID=A0ABU7JXI7_9NOCA|nr:TIGR03086 family metal-binding protein [Rhodococcus sp. CC-R104]MEE2034725.1 TIGR03086 family metal-binding protein [Rhodococcus sp. CC-R104]